MLNYPCEATIGLEYIEFFADIEREFGIELPDGVTRQFKTMRDVYEAVVKRTGGMLPAAGATPTMDDPVWQWLVQELETEFGVPRRVVHPEAHLYQDLALG